MKHLNVTVFEPGEIVATMSHEGKVAIFTVTKSGALVPSDNKVFLSGLTAEDGIEALVLSTRSYNLIKREGVNTIGDLLKFYDEKGRDGMLDIRNFSEKSADEIIGEIERVRGQV